MWVAPIVAIFVATASVLALQGCNPAPPIRLHPVASARLRAPAHPTVKAVALPPPSDPVAGPACSVPDTTTMSDARKAELFRQFSEEQATRSSRAMVTEADRSPATACAAVH